MKLFRSFFLLILFTTTVKSQSLKVTSAPSSSKILKVEVLDKAITLKDVDGKVITAGTYNTPDQSDPSLKTYPLQNGGFIVRENIANFLVYDSFGKVVRSISNSTQSKGGESISEVAADANGKTIVLYNPKVISNGKSGSRAKVIGLNRTELDIFYSDSRVMRTVKVSESGEFIAIATGKEGTDDEVVIVDRYGNKINTVSFDQEIVGVNLYGSGSTLTVYSNSRAAVYNVLNGKRLGSTSFRSPVHFANYSSSDKTIIALTGDMNGNTISNVEIHAVNIDARKVARGSYTASVNEVTEPILERVGRFNYVLKGFSKDLRIKATF
tara:strand:- start:41540 stop:42514 length:975 start_codon:yes stop_codon:yes gene_type:complete